MNKRQRKKQRERNRFQLWVDGSSEGMFGNPSKARRFLQVNYGSQWHKWEYDIIDLFKFNQEYMSAKADQIIVTTP